jgi:23S rRNA (cytidine1920-2'-O)/16S rRNA (cytidine1409-2'-O)-methyltransferase
VVVIERTNIRTMDPALITRPVDLVTIDTAFISLKIVVPATFNF